ncbi:MAG: hypothetical protein ABIJ42_06270 [Acidobacteriota bacterium]
MIKGRPYRAFLWPVVLILLFAGCGEEPAGDETLIPGMDGSRQLPQLFTPVRPIDELRSAALEAEPPVGEGDFLEPDL